METAKTLGQRIRAAYLAKGFNRSSLARAIGVALTTVLAWEEDRVKSMEFDNLESLSVLLGVSTSWLLGEDEQVTEPHYKAWRMFLATPAGESMTDSERVTLASIRFHASIVVTPDLYYALLVGLRMRASA